MAQMLTQLKPIICVFFSFMSIKIEQKIILQLVPFADDGLLQQFCLHDATVLPIGFETCIEYRVFVP